jgi:hypothetical protein
LLCSLTRCSQKNITIYFSSDPKKCKEDVEAQPATATGSRTTWIEKQNGNNETMRRRAPSSEAAPARAQE